VVGDLTRLFPIAGGVFWVGPIRLPATLPTLRVGSPPLDDILVAANFEQRSSTTWSQKASKATFEALYILRKIESGEQVKFRPNMSV
jgi:hypothetical protein